MLCLIFLLSIVSATAFQGLSTSQLMMVDHVLSCRAHCVDAFAPKSDHLNDSSCYHQNDCLSCWKYCETLYQKRLIMDSICEDSRICFTGCQMACYVYRDDLRSSRNQQMSEKFDAPLKISCLKEMNKLEIQWQSPVQLLPTSSPVMNIVYALFWKMVHDQNIWVPLKHTINNSFTINNFDGFSSDVELLLLAYTRDGAIAESLFTKGRFRKIHKWNNEAGPEKYYCVNAFRGLSTNQLMMVDQVLTCRAHCVDAFALKNDPLRDSSCQNQIDCQMCWENCGLFYQKYEVWGSICKDSRICFTGCQMACSVYRGDLLTGKNLEMSWNFAEPLKITHLTKMNKLEIRWQSPVPLLATSSTVPNIVYALFWKMAHRQNIWFPLNHTITNSFTTNNLDIIHSGVDFLLLAYTRDGLVAALQWKKNNSEKLRLFNSESLMKTNHFFNEEEVEFYWYLGGTIFASMLILVIGVVLIFCVRTSPKPLLPSKNRNNASLKQSQCMTNKDETISLNHSNIQLLNCRRPTATLHRNGNFIKIKKPSNCLRRAAIPPLPAHMNMPRSVYYINVPTVNYATLAPMRFGERNGLNFDKNYVKCSLDANSQAHIEKEQILLSANNLQKEFEKHFSTIV
ncbi:hypothetical protein T4B_9659 [Trichinella pseudospiralis]|uniref:Uncharacterized protein n=1 Tax=Trichinella pseudospiralis TaxID=6337 RepID=A0A0V1EEE6_TRIPS|nr:hypothetical protein T4A_11846 [Trichinella pseudospiralis]KRZ32986.1 hypothetical protein T4B_9659 [Trichinella pseudospiralis]KRZ44530.1 hypothetical protein T4C_9369 [Trichinella pseudospiralis]